MAVTEDTEHKVDVWVQLKRQKSSAVKEQWVLLLQTPPKNRIYKIKQFCQDKM